MDADTRAALQAVRTALDALTASRVGPSATLRETVNQLDAVLAKPEKAPAAKKVK